MDDGTVTTKHFPDPVEPSSHVAQPEGQGWHEGPKNPDAQLLQDKPMKPGAQLYCPDARQVPVLTHGEEHTMDWMSVRLSVPTHT